MNLIQHVHTPGPNIIIMPRGDTMKMSQHPEGVGDFTSIMTPSYDGILNSQSQQNLTRLMTLQDLSVDRKWSWQRHRCDTQSASPPSSEAGNGAGSVSLQKFNQSLPVGYHKRGSHLYVTIALSVSINDQTLPSRASYRPSSSKLCDVDESRIICKDRRKVKLRPNTSLKEAIASSKNKFEEEGCHMKFRNRERDPLSALNRSCAYTVRYRGKCA